MQDTADTAPAPEAAGQPEADDTQAQELLAEAAQQPETAAGNGGQAEQEATPGKPPAADPWDDPASARREIEKLRRENANRRTQLRELEPLAQKYREYEDAQKTEIQRATEAQQAAEQRAAQLQSANARLMAAATHNLPADLIDDLGDGTEEEIDARAQRLAELIKAAEQRGAATSAAQTPSTPSAPAAQRPVEALHAGAAPASQKPQSPDDWLRSLRDAGRG